LTATVYVYVTVITVKTSNFKGQYLLAYWPISVCIIWWWRYNRINMLDVIIIITIATAWWLVYSNYY